MSSWGYTDNTAIAGTVTGYTQNVDIVGSSTYFLSNVKGGDYLTIVGQKYQVNNVISDTSLTLTSALSSATSGATAYLQQGPKYVANLALSDNVYTIQRIYGVDINEMNTKAVASLVVYTAGNYSTAAKNNTNVFIQTSGAVQPTVNATATITFTGANVTSFTITNPGAGYTYAVQQNTIANVYTSGATLPTENASANVNFTSSTVASNSSHTGWVHYFTYTGQDGAVRKKSEVLVAMSKNFTPAVAGDEEDTVFPD